MSPSPSKLRSLADRFRELPNQVKDIYSRHDVVKAILARDARAGRLLARAMDEGAFAQRVILARCRQDTLGKNPDDYASFWVHVSQQGIGGESFKRRKRHVSTETVGTEFFDDACDAIAHMLEEEARWAEEDAKEKGLDKVETAIAGEQTPASKRRAEGGSPVVKLPELKPHDRQAWQLSMLHEMTQERVAAALNKEHGKTYTQGQVSRMIARAKAHSEASGLADKMPKRLDPPLTVDPAKLDLGARIDKRKPRPSDLTRLDDDVE